MNGFRLAQIDFKAQVSNLAGKPKILSRLRPDIIHTDSQFFSNFLRSLILALSHHSLHLFLVSIGERGGDREF